MTCKEIIKKYLEDNGFDGLCEPDLVCGCGLDNIFPCDENFGDCQPAHKIKNPDCENCDSKDWCDAYGQSPEFCYSVAKEAEE